MSLSIDSLLLAKALVGGGGTAPTGTKQIGISQNGTTVTDVSDYANAEITANVPNTYDSSDNGKVVSNGALVAQNTLISYVSGDATLDTTLYKSVDLHVLPKLFSGTAVGTGSNIIAFVVGEEIPYTNYVLALRVSSGSGLSSSDTPVLWTYFVVDGDCCFISPGMSDNVHLQNNSFIDLNSMTMVTIPDAPNYTCVMTPNGPANLVHNLTGMVMRYVDVGAANGGFMMGFGFTNAAPVFANGVQYTWKMLFFGTSNDILRST